MTFREATPADEPAWQALLGRCSAGDFLHDWAWASVAAFDGQPQRRFVLEQDGELVALAAAQVRPIGLGRSFWYVPHGPVLDYAVDGAGSRLTTVLAGLAAAARQSGGIVVRLEPRLELGDPAGERLSARATPVPERLQVGHTRLVPLAHDATLQAGFDADLRWEIRRAEREGVTTSVISDPTDEAAIDRLHGLVEVTQQRAGFPLPPRERYRIAWRGLAAAGRACLVEARHGDDLLASGMLVIEGGQSFFLFSGSRRESPGEPKRYATAALQWAILGEARRRGAAIHDLWGIAPPDSAPDHPWAGVGAFKRQFGGREVTWAGSWEVVVAPTAYRLRSALSRLRMGGGR